MKWRLLVGAVFVAAALGLYALGLSRMLAIPLAFVCALAVWVARNIHAGTRGFYLANLGVYFACRKERGLGVWDSISRMIDSRYPAPERRQQALVMAKPCLLRSRDEREAVVSCLVLMQALEAGMKPQDMLKYQGLMYQKTQAAYRAAEGRWGQSAAALTDEDKAAVAAAEVPAGPGGDSEQSAPG